MSSNGVRCSIFIHTASQMLLLDSLLGKKGNTSHLELNIESAWLDGEHAELKPNKQNGPQME